MLGQLLQLLLVIQPQCLTLFPYPQAVNQQYPGVKPHIRHRGSRGTGRLQSRSPALQGSLPWKAQSARDLPPAGGGWSPAAGPHPVEAYPAHQPARPRWRAAGLCPQGQKCSGARAASAWRGASEPPLHLPETSERSPMHPFRLAAVLQGALPLAGLPVECRGLTLALRIPQTGSHLFLGVAAGDLDTLSRSGTLCRCPCQTYRGERFAMQSCCPLVHGARVPPNG
mmetsp:Transcript_15978/g.40607  ORF Transcript_15978/g.40607 Transcript_15978/m.40607 type:complete len:226 (+) Transcript_15978:1271-1948(+)